MEKTTKQSEGNIIKIVLVGPESTGKSTVASELAKHFDTVWVKEYLRDFAEEKYSKNKDLVYSDNLLIANGQLELEQEAIENANRFIFCDTDILQTVVYSFEYYNKVQTTLKKRLKINNTELYILLNLDVEWKEDPQRDKPDDRERIFSDIENTLIKYNKKYVILKGKDDFRLKNATKIVETFFPKDKI